jgi:hypothetical protein
MTIKRLFISGIYTASILLSTSALAQDIHNFIATQDELGLYEYVQKHTPSIEFFTKRDENKISPLELAVKMGNQNIAIFIEEGIKFLSNRDQPVSEEYPSRLHSLVDHDDWFGVHFYVWYNEISYSDFTLRDSEKNTILDLAILNDNRDMYVALLEYEQYLKFLGKADVGSSPEVASESLQSSSESVELYVSAESVKTVPTVNIKEPPPVLAPAIPPKAVAQPKNLRRASDVEKIEIPAICMVDHSVSSPILVRRMESIPPLDLQLSPGTAKNNAPVSVQFEPTSLTPVLTKTAENPIFHARQSKPRNRPENFPDSAMIKAVNPEDRGNALPPKFLTRLPAPKPDLVQSTLDRWLTPKEKKETKKPVPPFLKMRSSALPISQPEGDESESLQSSSELWPLSPTKNKAVRYVERPTLVPTTNDSRRSTEIFSFSEDESLTSPRDVTNIKSGTKYH